MIKLSRNQYVNMYYIENDPYRKRRKIKLSLVIGEKDNELSKNHCKNCNGLIPNYRTTDFCCTYCASSYASKKNWNNLDFRTRQYRSRVAAWNKPGFREKMSKKRKEQFKDKDFLENQKRLRREQWKNPEYRQRKIQQIKDSWNDPNSGYNTKEYRNGLSERSKKLFEDEEFRTKFFESSKKATKEKVLRNLNDTKHIDFIEYLKSIKSTKRNRYALMTAARMAVSYDDLDQVISFYIVSLKDKKTKYKLGITDNLSRRLAVESNYNTYIYTIDLPAKKAIELEYRLKINFCNTDSSETFKKTELDLVLQYIQNFIK